MKIKTILLCSFLICFSQANEMVKSEYEIIFNNQNHFEGDGHDHSNENSFYSQKQIIDSHSVIKNQNELIVENKNNLFEKCIKKSNNLINILEELKKLPENERIVYLYNSNYWKGLPDEEQNKTLLILNKIETVSEEQYIIIKGKIATLFKEECIAITKN